MNTTCEASELEPYRQAAREKILATVGSRVQATLEGHARGSGSAPVIALMNAERLD